MEIGNWKLEISKSEMGQGLLETVIALSVIITGLVGALALSLNNLSSTGDSGSRVIAGNLAREGIEVARGVRDSNWLAGRTWYDGLLQATDDHTAVADFSPVPNVWNVDFGPDILGASETRLFWDGNAYAHQGAGNATPFFRLLAIDEICGETNPPSECADGICGEGYACALPRGVRLLSTVEWSERGRHQSITIEDRLYDWK